MSLQNLYINVDFFVNNIFFLKNNAEMELTRNQDFCKKVSYFSVSRQNV